MALPLLNIAAAYATSFVQFVNGKNGEGTEAATTPPQTFPQRTNGTYVPIIAPPIQYTEVTNLPPALEEVTGTCEKPAPPLPQLARKLDKERKKMDTIIISEARQNLSHGCIHISDKMSQILYSYGVSKGTSVIVHNYDKSPKKIPPPLTKPHPTFVKSGKRAYTNPTVEFYPGAEIGIITVSEGGKRVQYSFRIQCGLPPGCERIGSDGFSQDPTPAGKYVVTSAGPLGNSPRYKNSNLPGDAEVRIVKKQGKKIVQYRTGPKENWQDFTPTTEKQKALETAILTDNEFRSQYLLTRNVLVKDSKKGWQYKTKTYYVGNDFGNGNQLASSDTVIGERGAQIVFSLASVKEDGTTESAAEKIHTTPAEEETARLLWDKAVANLLSDEPVSLDDVKTEVHDILLKIEWKFDPKTNTLDLSALPAKEKEVLDKFINSSTLMFFTGSTYEAALESLVVMAYNIALVEKYLQSPSFKALKTDFRLYWNQQMKNMTPEQAGFLLQTIFQGTDQNIPYLFETVAKVPARPLKHAVAMVFNPGDNPILMGSRNDLALKANVHVLANETVDSITLTIGITNYDNGYKKPITEKEFIEKSRAAIKELKTKLPLEKAALLKKSYTDEEILAFWPKPDFFGTMPLVAYVDIYKAPEAAD